MDPQAKDVESYLEFSKAKGMEIIYAIDTHIQADHLSGGRDLAELTGAEYCLHESADVAFDFTPLTDEQKLELGNVTIDVLHRPGHTPESISLLVTDKTRGPEPWFLLTGDTLFVGSIGRPDLPGRAEESAAEIYHSLHEKILTLPDALEIYPAHFAGSVCGAGMSGKPMSTIAFEKRWNPVLSLDRQDFIDKLTTGLPAKPAEMTAILRANRGTNSTDECEN
ncbi:MAG TPA: MBL fold metallo-hydrolase [Pyrinomonadaceae bacterium]|nr:MBL fold metallo-hydrolase [Pyrinomonadaceae bacterium]